MKIKKGNLNFDQTGRAYPDNPHIEENWDCIWENEGKHYKLVGDTNDKEWSEVTQLDILTSHMVYEEYLGREEEPKNAVFGYKTSIVGQMLDSDGGFGQVEQSKEPLKNLIAPRSESMGMDIEEHFLVRSTLYHQSAKQLELYLK